MNKIRVGVVGLGHLGFKQAENSTTTKNASLIVVCDHSEEELKKVKEKITNDTIGTPHLINIASRDP